MFDTATEAGFWVTTLALAFTVGLLFGVIWGAKRENAWWVRLESMRKRAEDAEHRVLDPSTDLWGGAGPDFRPVVASAA